MMDDSTQEQGREVTIVEVGDTGYVFDGYNSPEAAEFLDEANTWPGIVIRSVAAGIARAYGAIGSFELASGHSGAVRVTTRLMTRFDEAGYAGAMRRRAR